MEMEAEEATVVAAEDVEKAEEDVVGLAHDSRGSRSRRAFVV